MREFPQVREFAAKEKVEYQPVSGWAVAGFVLGVLTALIVLGCFLMTVASGQPVLPPSLLVVLVGGGGIVVCFVAGRMIQYSEGTRTGAGLAGWGMWLSVAGVLGFFAYTFATNQALYQQANAFLLNKDDDAKSIPEAGFFFRLVEPGKNQRVEANCAFLLTLPSSSRGGNPENEKDMQERHNVSGKNGEPGRLTQFRSNRLIQFLFETTAANESGVPDVTFEPRGGASCPYDPAKRHYEVTRIYRIKTPEVEIDASVQVNSEEAPEPGVRRRWVVALPQLQEINRHMTPLGENLAAFRQDVYKFLLKWDKEHPSRPMPFEDVDKSLEKLFPEPFLREHVLSRLKEPGPNEMTIISPAQLIATPWKMVDGKLQISLPVRVTIAGRLGPAITTMKLNGEAIVESEQPIDPHASGIQTPTWKFVGIRWTGYAGGRRDS